MIVAVVDGMGGGIGSQLIALLRQDLPPDVRIYALGTNSAATTNMMKEKANKGATGESAIVYSIKKVDVVVGSLGIVIPNSMMGEITPKIAEAITSCSAKKILIPIMDNEDITLLGVEKKPLFLSIKETIEKIKGLL
jgi:antitoxin component of MazEF toxin-antitoxin module